MFNKILVPVDGSDSSWRALDAARQLGEKFGGSIEVVHVVQPYYTIPNISMAGDAPFIPLNVEEIEATGRNLLAIVATRMEGYTLPFESKLEFGDPAKRILAVAKDGAFDAIVIGSRGLSGFAELFLGSVSAKVAQYATPPVLIIK